MFDSFWNISCIIFAIKEDKVYKLVGIILMLSVMLNIAASETNFEIKSGSLGNEEIIFNLGEYSLSDINVKGITYKRIEHATKGFIVDFGKPEIPTVSTIIALPDKGNPIVSLKIIESEIIDNIDLYPQQELQSESKPKSSEFIIDSGLYSKNILYPSKSCTASEPGVIRNQRVSAITVNPFRYNPGDRQLQIIKKAEITLSMDNSLTTNPVNAVIKKSRVFDKLFSTTLLNYNNLESGDFQRPSILVIHRENNDIRDLMNEYANIKTHLGFDVKIAEFSDAEATKSNIKTYLLDAYNNWENPPEFICLAGDALGTAYDIPTERYATGEGDHYYSLLDGNDILADAFVGRLSFENISELIVIVNKIYKYEFGLLPAGNSDWYNKVLLVGDPDDSGPSCVDTKRQVKQMIQDNNPNFSFTEEYVSNFDYVMTHEINSGVSYFNYRGFHGMSGWTVDDIIQLDNTNKLPLAVFLTCAVGNFASNESSRPEELLRLGTPTSPKGAIAAIALATSYTHTVFNNIVDAGIYHTIFVEKQFSPGIALAKAKFEMWRNFPTNPHDFVSKFSYWNNLMGDPALHLWTGTPEQLQVSLPDNLEEGMNSFRVEVADNEGNPVNAEVIVVSDSTVYFSGTAENGTCVIPVKDELENEFDLVCKYHNFIPDVSTQTINSNNLRVRMSNFSFVNSNSAPIIHPNDAIDLSLTFENHSNTASNPINVTLEIPDFLVLVNNNYIQLPSLTSNQVYQADQNVNIDFINTLSDGMRVPVTIHYTDTVNNETWQETFYLYASAPDITISNAVAIEMDIPETQFYISMDITNQGSQDITNTTLTLRPIRDNIVLTDSTESIASLSLDTPLNLTDAFSANFNSSFYTGREEQFLLKISNIDFQQTIPLTICFGNVTQSSITGPDAYGYVCLEENDEVADPDLAYNWIEIENTGTNTYMFDDGDNGDRIDVDIPMNFRFYGSTHDRLTISSNGWVSPGSVDLRDFMNWHLPSICGPKPIIAAFWDDLNTGNIYYEYDDVNKYFIIEWKDMKGDYTLSNQTFQMIIFDCMEYPTISGDSKIKIQYNDINNDNVGQYGDLIVQHGNYATVGIQNYNASSGLEYTFNNTYPASASELSDGKAIMFKTLDMTFVDSDINIESINIINEFGEAELIAGYDANISLKIRNNSLNTIDGMYVKMQVFNENVIVYNNEINFPAIDSGESEMSFNKLRLHINDNLEENALRLKLTIHNGDKNIIRVVDLNVQKSNFDLQRYYFTFDNNREFNTGDSLMCCFEINNNSPIDFNNVDVTVNSESGIFDSSTNSKTIYFWEGNALKYLLFPMEYQNGMTNDIFDCTMTISHEDFNRNYKFNIKVDSKEILLYNDFNSHELSGIKASNGQFGISDSTSFAGGSSEELVFAHDSQTYPYVSYLELGRYYSLNTSSTRLSMKYYISSTGGTHTLQVGFDDIWFNLLTLNENTSTEINELVSSVDYGDKLMKVRIKSEVPSGGLTIYIDDLKSVVNHYQGFAFVKGDIDSRIDPLSDNLSIETFFTSGVVNSDNTYYLAVPQMSGWFTASCPGYKDYTSPANDFDANQIYNFDIIMESIVAPENLSLTDNTGSLTLNWTCSTPEEIDEYIIYRSMNNEIFTPVDTTLTTTWSQNYSDELNLKYFVVSVSDGYESLPTDTVELILVDNANEDVNQFKTGLTGNYPNPFNPETRIDFKLAENSHVRIDIYNIKGQKVRTLVNARLSKGKNSVIWQGKNDRGDDVCSGVYFYRLNTEKEQDIKKCILLK